MRRAFDGIESASAKTRLASGAVAMSAPARMTAMIDFVIVTPARRRLSGGERADTTSTNARCAGGRCSFGRAGRNAGARAGPERAGGRVRGRKKAAGSGAEGQDLGHASHGSH